MLEKGTSGLMSGEGKRAAASRPRTALFLDSTSCAIGAGKLQVLRKVACRAWQITRPNQFASRRYRVNLSESSKTGALLVYAAPLSL